MGSTVPPSETELSNEGSLNSDSQEIYEEGSESEVSHDIESHGDPPSDKQGPVVSPSPIDMLIDFSFCEKHPLERVSPFTDWPSFAFQLKEKMLECFPVSP